MKFKVALALLLISACSSNDPNQTPAPTCQPDARRCVNNDVEACRIDGTAWTFYRSCGTDQTCRNGLCETTPRSCGDNNCSAADSETCNNCPEDCGQCCGNGNCEPTYQETSTSCPQDCKQAIDSGQPPVDAGPGKDQGPEADSRPAADSKPAADSTITPDSSTGCPEGTTKCSSDGYGVLHCGFDGAAYSFGQRVPCDKNETCKNGVCSDSVCNTPEIVLAVDHSSSMVQFQHWDWVVAGLKNRVMVREDGALWGFRQFPTSGCSVGTAQKPSNGAASSIVSSFRSPTSSASTPLGAALAGLHPIYGDPNQAQAVILVRWRRKL
jgi:hypothetical protein